METLPKRTAHPSYLVVAGCMCFLRLGRICGWIHVAAADDTSPTVSDASDKSTDSPANSIHVDRPGTWQHTKYALKICDLSSGSVAMALVGMWSAQFLGSFDPEAYPWELIKTNGSWLDQRILFECTVGSVASDAGSKQHRYHTPAITAQQHRSDHKDRSLEVHLALRPTCWSPGQNHKRRLSFVAKKFLPFPRHDSSQNM